MTEAEERMMAQLRKIELAIVKLDSTMREVVGLTMTKSRDHDGPHYRLDRIEERLDRLESDAAVKDAPGRQRLAMDVINALGRDQQTLNAAVKRYRDAAKAAGVVLTMEIEKDVSNEAPPLLLARHASRRAEARAAAETHRQAAPQGRGFRV